MSLHLFEKTAGPKMQGLFRQIGHEAQRFGASLVPGGGFSKSLKRFKRVSPRISASNAASYKMWDPRKHVLNATRAARTALHPLTMLNTAFLGDQFLDMSGAAGTYKQLGILKDTFKSPESIEQKAREMGQADLPMSLAKMFLDKGSYDTLLSRKATRHALGNFDFTPLAPDASLGQKARNYIGEWGKRHAMEEWLRADMQRRIDGRQRGMIDERQIGQFLSRPEWTDTRQKLQDQWSRMLNTTNPQHRPAGALSAFPFAPPPPGNP